MESGVEDVTVPVYLGDSLQLRTETGSLLAGQNVTIEVESDPLFGGSTRRLEFPRALVEQADWFDGVMYRIGECIEAGDDPLMALDDAGIPPGAERNTLENTITRLVEFHAEGRDHIWAYYIRNLVRPAWLSSEDGRVNVILGNPPWLTYSRTDATLRTELERQSKQTYGIWEGGRYAPHQDTAGLFYTRCVDLYLRDGGTAAMVLPHSALQTGQYRRRRTGSWAPAPKSRRRGASAAPMSPGTGADLSVRAPWDLEQVDPNTFFPVPACVVFAKKASPDAARPLGDQADVWRGPEGGPFVRTTSPLADTGDSDFASPYAGLARQGATIVPRVLFFVDVAESSTAIAQGIVKVSPRRGPKDKAPWKDLRLDELDTSIEKDHIWPVHLGETVAPFLVLEPQSAVLPIQRGGVKGACAKRREECDLRHRPQHARPSHARPVAHRRGTLGGAQAAEHHGRPAEPGGLHGKAERPTRRRRRIPSRLRILRPPDGGRSERWGTGCGLHAVLRAVRDVGRGSFSRLGHQHPDA